MTVDILLGLVLGLSVLMGAVRGALLEVLSLAAFGIALALCQPVGRVLLPAAAWLLPGASVLAVDAAATVFAGLMVFLVGTALTALAVRLARKGGKRFTTPDRVAGGALGGCRAVLIWLAAACFVPPVTRGTGAPPSWIGRQMQASRLLAAANRANPLLRLAVVRDARAFRQLLSDPAGQRLFLAEAATQRFLAHPPVAAALREGELEAALERGDLVTLMRAPAMQAALLEPGALTLFRRALADWRRAQAH